MSDCFADIAVGSMPGMHSADALARAFGRNVGSFRRAQSLPKGTFASMVGISRPYLNAIELGRADVRLSTVMRIADVLATSPIVLLHDGPSLCPPGNDASGANGVRVRCPRCMDAPEQECPRLRELRELQE